MKLKALLLRSDGALSLNDSLFMFTENRFFAELST